MIEIRKSDERGYADHGWLKSRHSFSFADYFDPRHVQFGPLRVINEDRVAPGKGFATHGHHDMEIVSYVLSGALEHKDNMGNGSVIRPGDVQRMSAGTGVRHSEFNPSRAEPVHFLQIWIIPDRTGIQPGYEQRHFTVAERRGRLRLIASSDGAEGSVTIHQNARVYAGLFDGTEAGSLGLAAGRQGYVHLARGRAVINGAELGNGDAAMIVAADRIEIGAAKTSEVLVFDLP